MAASTTDRLIDFIHRLATGSRKRRNLFTPVGASIFAALIGLTVYVSLLVDGRLGLPLLPPRPYHLLAGLPLVAAGVFLSGWAALIFLRAKGTPVPVNPPPKLVVSGPYAYSRNPMLGGIFLIFFGLGLALRSISLVLVFVPLFIGFDYWELKNIEEPELVKRLGSDYLAYRQITPMFIPWRLGKKKTG